MKRVFIVGDHKTGTGPANVTKEYIKYFPKGTLYQKMTSKYTRLPELVIKVMLSDIILFSGYSYQNVLGMKLARKFGKKTAYVVHGAITHENKINHDENAKMSEIEEETLKLADRLYAVSERFAGWMKKEYPQYENKIFYVLNGIDGLKINFKNVENTLSPADEDEKSRSIISIGGGMPRKMILQICAAIEHINKNSSHPLTLYVIGKDGFDTEAINKYPFVKNLGLVPGKKKEELFTKCGLFIQNSVFETFGLAPVEALTNGMSILVSNICGVLDIFSSINDDDVIFDPNDTLEIARKIENVLENPNHDRLIKDMDFETMSFKVRSQELYESLLEM